MNNMIIKGDNVTVMNGLLDNTSYGAGSIDLMLWDPPYNTGNKHFMYGDKFLSHESWLRFMQERFVIAKKLMKESGSIAVHISYHELFRLGLLMDEVFGEDNRLGIINWECSYSPKNDSKGIASTTDYVLVYASNKKKFARGIVPRTEKMNAAYGNHEGDTSVYKSGGLDGPWRNGNIIGAWRQENFSRFGRPRDAQYNYGIQNPFTNKIHYAPAGREWRISRDKALFYLKDWYVEYYINEQGDLVIPEGQSRDRAQEIQKTGPWPRIFFGKSGNGGPIEKRYLKNLKSEGRVLGTYWDIDEMGCISLPYEVSGHNGEAKKLIKEILGGNTVFNTPKPLKITELLIQYLSPKDGVVLDAFAGSGTTAHGVLSLNAQDPTCNRSFILIESEDYVETITCERVQRVINGNWAVETKYTVPLDGSFEFITI